MLTEAQTCFVGHIYLMRKSVVNLETDVEVTEENELKKVARALDLEKTSLNFLIIF